MYGYGNSMFLATHGILARTNAAVLPVNTVAPAITGTAQEGQTLTCSTGTWTGTPTITYTYQWKRNGSNIGSATNSTYTLVTADVGQSIKCTVTATNGAGSVNADSNTVTPTSAVDPDAQAFITAASITDPTQQAAINQLVVDLKGYGVWTKLRACYPFIGGTSSTHKWNLKDPRDLDAAFRLRFFGGAVHTANGVQGNALNAYYNTYLNVNSLPISSNAAGVYIRTNASEEAVDFGAINTSAFNSAQFGSRNTSNQLISRWYQASNGLNTTSNTDSRGFYQLTRRNSSEYITAKNTSKLVVATPASSVIPSMPFYGLAAYFVPTAADAFHSSKQIAFHYFADSSLSNTELDNLYTAVQTFQTTLGRQV